MSQKKKEHDGHVQFSVEADKHRSAVGIQQVDDRNIQAHVGFLQLNHRYEIQLPIPLPTPASNYQPQLQPNLSIKSVSAEASESEPDLLLVMVELLAHKQKLLRERFVLQGPTEEQAVTVTVNARVLGPGQGTPMLRDGVRLVEVLPLEESEVSDWQGFD